MIFDLEPAANACDEDASVTSLSHEKSGDTLETRKPSWSAA